MHVIGPQTRAVGHLPLPPDAAESLGMSRQMDGREVSFAEDGLKAIDAAGQQRPQIVLSDLGLPYLDGYEVAKHIRATPGGRETILVAVIGRGHDTDQEHSRDVEFDRHLVEPIESGTLYGCWVRLQSKRGIDNIVTR